MKKALLSSVFILCSSFVMAQQGTLQYPPPPAPGYVYTVPYAGTPTYAGVGVSAATAAGDIYCVGGSATRNIRITKIGISATAASAVAVTVSIILRSTADVGSGTAIVIGAYDQTHAAATAVAKSYDTVPAVGAAIATVRSAKVAVGTTGNSNNIGEMLFEFTPAPLLLRGVSQYACINVSAVGTGASILVFHEHVETTVGYP
jgi:hypothetical protein